MTSTLTIRRSAIFAVSARYGLNAFGRESFHQPDIDQQTGDAAGAAFSFLQFDIDVGGIPVIAQKAVKLGRDKALNDFFLADSLQFFINRRQKGLDFLMLDLGVLYFFDEMIELLFANFAARRDFYGRKFLSRFVFRSA